MPWRRAFAAKLRYGALLQAQAGWAGTAEAYAAGLGPAPVEATGATPVERP
ncbi:MAG: hypothetical protein LBD51_08735 [Bifidobacteriaceae bacterium]|nr:hypothetical protein [Bifidobacteriaceae bacterium]